jgi:DNA polymerase III subunit gamma/tau
LTYQTLYRKYRSQTFADLVGQEATRRALQGAIASDRVSHAYLFSGTRGTGKTSTARLLAKAVNCLRRAPGESEPCNECESCVQVQNGSALDLIEIDAASNRGIDEIRDLREKVNLAPAVGRRKVYIIDEAHMLTAEAFNALLKTLEEPPAHVMFILCTTESNKVPLTVLGRCQQFVFRRFSDDQIGARLAFISEREGIVVEPEALAVIARVAQGSMRDAIGLLDQLVPLADGPITMAGAREVLGVADPDRLRALLDLVLAGRPSEALEVLSGIYEGGGELRQVVRGLMERCRDLLIAAIEGQDGAGRTRLSAVLDALLHLDGEMRRHAEPRFLVEATLVRLAVETPPAGAALASPSPVGATLASPSSGSQPAAAAPAPPASPSSAAPPATSPHPPVPPVPPVAQAPLVESSPPARAAGMAEASDGWSGVLEALSPKIRAYFREARPQVDGDTLLLSFPYGFHHQMASEHAGQIEPLVRAWLGEGAKLDLRLESVSRPTGPAAPVERTAAPEEDPLIKAAERKLEGRVVRVRPLKES